MDKYITRNSDVIMRAVAKIPRNIVTKILRDKIFFMRYLLGYAILYNEKMDDVVEFIKITFTRLFYDDVPLKKVCFEMCGGPKISVVWRNRMDIYILLYGDFNYRHIHDKLKSMGFIESKKSQHKMKYKL